MRVKQKLEFTWCLATDRLYADTAVAFLFGLDVASTLTGRPSVDYLSRIHPSDRPFVAKLWSKAITTGTPYRAEYRVTGSDGRTRGVMAFGRCFQDQTGNPVHYAGIVHPTIDVSKQQSIPMALS